MQNPQPLQRSLMICNSPTGMEWEEASNGSLQNFMVLPFLKMTKLYLLVIFGRFVNKNLRHYRETRGLEIDLLIRQGQELDAVEIKSGATTSIDFFRNLVRFRDRFGAATETSPIRSHLVYGGEDSQQRSRAQVLSWRDVQRLIAA